MIIKKTDIKISNWLAKKIKKPEILKDCYILSETCKALIIEYNNQRLNIPKSQIKATGANVYTYQSDLQEF